jgi:hypothetical protein
MTTVRYPLPFSYNTPVRLWTLHPRYLDTKGLLALWREALLAQKVIRDQTAGYRNHPQLARFKAQPDPAAAIAAYLHPVYREAESRGYHFSRERIQADEQGIQIGSTRGQLMYEWEHLKRKLEQRDRSRYEAAAAVLEPEAHPLFDIIAGEIESWEVSSRRS